MGILGVILTLVGSTNKYVKYICVCVHAHFRFWSLITEITHIAYWEHKQWLTSYTKFTIKHKLKLTWCACFWLQNINWSWCLNPYHCFWKNMKMDFWLLKTVRRNMSTLYILKWIILGGVYYVFACYKSNLILPYLHATKGI